MFLHHQLNNLPLICYDKSLQCTSTICTHYLCTNISYATESVFDTWVMRWLGQYYTFWTQNNSMHRLPLWISTLQGICGLTRQKWNLQQNLQVNKNSWYNKELYSLKIILYFSLLCVCVCVGGVLRRERDLRRNLDSCSRLDPRVPLHCRQQRSSLKSSINSSWFKWATRNMRSRTDLKLYRLTHLGGLCDSIGCRAAPGARLGNFWKGLYFQTFVCFIFSSLVANHKILEHKSRLQPVLHAGPACVLEVLPGEGAVSTLVTSHLKPSLGK